MTSVSLSSPFSAAHSQTSAAPVFTNMAWSPVTSLVRLDDCDTVHTASAAALLAKFHTRRKRKNLEDAQVALFSSEETMEGKETSKGKSVSSN